MFVHIFLTQFKSQPRLKPVKSPTTRIVFPFPINYVLKTIPNIYQLLMLVIDGRFKKNKALAALGAGRPKGAGAHFFGIIPL